MRATSLWTILVMVGLAGCGGGEKTETTSRDDVTPRQTDSSELPVEEISASHVVIQFIGVERELPDITRRKDEALALANEVARRAHAGENFADLAREYSDGPLAERGGYLGTFLTYEMPEAFSRTVLSLQMGQTSDPVLTEFGYHVIRREMKQTAGVRHVLVAYAGADRAPEKVTRTKEEARALAEEVLAEAKAGTAIDQLARRYSDDGSAEKGGDLGMFPRGTMAPAFDDAVFASEVGAVVGVVETPFGFHVLQRYQ